MTPDIDVDNLIDNMATEIDGFTSANSINAYQLVGIRTGGVWLASRLQEKLGRERPIGELNINFYRDDFSQIGLHPQVEASHLPFAIDGQHIVLIDDVLLSGRTVRAAMNEIFDYGRPASIILAVLIDLGRRDLPIKPDITGTELALDKSERVKLIGPDNLHIQIQQINPK